MSEQEQKFLKKLKNYLITGATTMGAGIITSMVIFYLNASGRIDAIEKEQEHKVNNYEFENYKKLQVLRESYLYETLEIIKSDVKDLKQRD